MNKFCVFLRKRSTVAMYRFSYLRINIFRLHNVLKVSNFLNLFREVRLKDPHCKFGVLRKRGTHPEPSGTCRNHSDPPEPHRTNPEPIRNPPEPSQKTKIIKIK